MLCVTSHARFAGPRHSQRFLSSSSSQAKAVSFFPSGKDTHGSNTQNQPFRMLMLAKPGSGKGTLSGKLTDKYDIQFMSSGDILRQHIKDKTEVGRIAKDVVASGGLLSDELMIDVLSNNLESLNGKNWILDGFPRTMGQGELLDTHLHKNLSPLSLVVHLDVPDEIILNRISDRWIHADSGRIYNLSYNPPKVPGIDDVTGEPLTRRPDDNPVTFGRRLKSFYEVTSPLLAYYQSREASGSGAKLVSLSGTTSDEIWPQLDSIVSASFKLKPKSTAEKPRSSVHEAVIRQAEREIRRTGSSGVSRTTNNTLDTTRSR